MNTIKLEYLAAARASGEDAQDFLQAQLAADLTPLSDGEGRFSAYCDPKGNVIALVHVIREGDSYLLIAARELLAPVLATLGRYRLRAKVSLEPVEGPIFGFEREGKPAYGTGGQSAAADAENASQWRARELRAGIAWLDPASSGRYLPQMLGFDRLGAVSFRKGCYPGQEVIARVRYLGKLKRLPLVVEARGLPVPTAGTIVELHAADGPAGSAEVVAGMESGDATTLFLVARVTDGRPATAIELNGRVSGVNAVNQAWATM